MNLKDAIASGKRYRRTGGNLGADFGNAMDCADEIHFFYSEKIFMPLTLGDVLAEDWEVETEPKKMKTVWQWRFKWNTLPNWGVDSELLTEHEACEMVKKHSHLSRCEKHAGPFEVEE